MQELKQLALATVLLFTVSTAMYYGYIYVPVGILAVLTLYGIVLNLRS